MPRVSPVAPLPPAASALLLAACPTEEPGPTPMATLEGDFAGEAVEVSAWSMFHWSEGLVDDAGAALDVDRLALSFSETPDLCRRERDFLAAARDADVPLPVPDEELPDHAALFEEHFPVVGAWDLTFWVGLPDGSDDVAGLEVDLAPTFDETYLNAEAVAARWDAVPPGDLLTWRSSLYYDEYGQIWTSASGTVRIDTFEPDVGATGSITAGFENDDGDAAAIEVSFVMATCF